MQFLDKSKGEKEEMSSSFEEICGNCKKWVADKEPFCKGSGYCTFTQRYTSAFAENCNKGRKAMKVKPDDAFEPIDRGWSLKMRDTGE